MEMAKNQGNEGASKKTKVPLRDKIKQAYISHLLTTGKDPASTYVFAQELKISEDDFYTEFSSFDALNKDIWNDFLQTTIQSLHDSKEYQDYSVREKLLSFYFTMMEVLKKNRSYVLFHYQNFDRKELIPSFLKKARTTYLDYINTLVEEGLQSGEFKKRPYLSGKYAEALWLQFLFVLRFWVKDDSKNFEQTDALIEKTVKLTFELLGESPLDSFIDLAKFLYQNK
jgi:AcrR family transcriptional regulator